MSLALPAERERVAPAARPAALVAGTSLAAMAVLSPIAMFVAIPAGLPGVAALVLLVVAALDVAVAAALVPVLESGGRMLARVAAGLRVGYAAAFAVAASELLAPADVARFDRVWGAALLLFALHLLALAALAWRSGSAPRWLAALLALAGLAYLADTAVAALAPASGFSAGIVAAVGELALTVWLLGRGGRAPRRAGEAERDGIR